MINRITILIVNYNSSDFIKISLYALKKLTKNSYIIYILDNGSTNEDYIKLKKITAPYKNVFLEKKETKLRGSEAHGIALNELVKKVHTQYFVILDADAIFLKKYWDEILISQINRFVKIVGTQAPIGSEKPQDFPLMFAALFETTTFKKLRIDFKPKDILHHLDTGHEMREKYLTSGFRGEIINAKTTRSFKRGPFKNVLCSEYYLHGIQQIFISHFGRGSTFGLSKYISKRSSWLFRIPLLGYLLAFIRGRYEKEKWIRICREIILEQI